MTYTIEQLAPGSYDVLLNGSPVAALVREVDRSDRVREWLVELFDETLPVDRPAPFTAQSHTFRSRPDALEWLGILDDAEGQLRERRVP